MRKTEFRTFGIGAQILKDLGVGKMRVLSAPARLASMAGWNLEVTGHETMPNP